MADCGYAAWLEEDSEGLWSGIQMLRAFYFPAFHCKAKKKGRAGLVY